MNRIAESDDNLAVGDGPSADALGETLSLADTPEEDADRYRDVIRELEEFEEAGVEGETGAVPTAEKDSRPGRQTLNHSCINPAPAAFTV